MKTYSWSNLRVESAFVLKDLRPWKGPVYDSDTVRVDMGKVPAKLPLSYQVDGRQQVSPDEYLFHRAGVASYLVSQGRRITVEPEPGVPEATVAAFLLGRPFTALACQRGLLSLHGGCFVSATGGTVIAASAGTGKSTLLAALQARGHGLVSDDSAVVQFEKGAPVVFPTSQRVRLMLDVAARFASAEDCSDMVRPGMDKCALPFLKPLVGAVPLANVLFLRRDGDVTQLVPTGHLEALDLLSTHLNRPRLVDLILGPSERFRQVARLADQVDCFRLSVPDDLAQLDEVAELISARFS